MSVVETDRIGLLNTAVEVGYVAVISVERRDKPFE